VAVERVGGGVIDVIADDVESRAQFSSGEFVRGTDTLYSLSKEGAGSARRW